MLSCKEVARTVSTGDVNPVGWPRRLAVKLHLMMCRHCRRYAEQLEALDNAARSSLHQPPEAPENLAKIQSEILDRLSQLPAGDESKR